MVPFPELSTPLKHQRLDYYGRMVGIAWKVTWSTESDLLHSWKSIEHFSTLPYGWIPKNGVEFIRQFVSILEKKWTQLCDVELGQLNQQV